MDIRPIRSEADYDNALAEIETYFDREPARGSPEADHFDILAALIAAYENERWPIDAPRAVDAIRMVMDSKGYTQADLAALLGSRSRASEILSGRRKLTMEQARKLHEAWQVPAESLIAA